MGSPCDHMRFTPLGCIKCHSVYLRGVKSYDGLSHAHVPSLICISNSNELSGVEFKLPAYRSSSPEYRMSYVVHSPDVGPELLRQAALFVTAVISVLTFM